MGSTEDVPPVAHSDVINQACAVEKSVEKPAKGGEAWSIDFTLPKMKRKTTRKEREAILCSKIRGQLQTLSTSSFSNIGDSQQVFCSGNNTDSEGNRHLQTVDVDGMADPSTLIPKNLPTTREDLEKRVCLRIPRLLAVAKQYPKSCGITSLTSVWNYLYTRIGENPMGADRPPVSQEEVMSIIGFSPPFDAISWGPFTGNGTLIRWFHALNRHFAVKGRAYVLYKPQGVSRTACTAEEALRQLKDVLQNPQAAVIYHCHNHYMVPIGYQEIPHAQADCYAPNVPESSCDTTVFIGDVSRGRHEAMYARKWSDIVKDLMTQSPEFYNIRRPELGIQTRVPKKKGCDTDRDHESEGNRGQPLGQKRAVISVEQPTETVPPRDAEAVLSPTSDPEAKATVGRAGPPPKRKAKKAGGGNLHCLICFRCDQVEERPERFETSSSDRDSEGSSSSSSTGVDEPAADGGKNSTGGIV
ncbi:hypothetical protein, conserved [Trypanosoma brucei gambiense DAL972]|uniref:Uncharacterized protein n=1 Tax=Trypanosoma brucei gambiense (strain MHOM/CI/86/DAL972) TaxID=679716 RepID=C9ZTF6_TRYB9|nr:hypothetical protein, conserved [Trypanosoma brucei gambiense DAL972]CBH12691.1 hypothetical protein, conserved [Trypanosoma brucei gambiense DAL972]|eukprot:XP_011774971.1 hypothetical protein, conserved [Trypanosoma brucei gambiense DAL972]